MCQQPRFELLLGGKGKYLYSFWQFTDTGKTLRGLETVLEQLPEID
ncbi:MAG: hypothetical protein KME09_00925 [Pleurocapsa minor HA4230-MV1]|nr:hypothetical protein [Pleurocapsa minor HA4230-MV1]